MVIARSLVEALRDAGHPADIVVTPQNRFGRQAAAYLATWLTDVGSAEGRPIDQVISLRYPSYAVRHPNHVCWLNHTMREYYDLWPRFSGGLGDLARFKEGVRRRDDSRRGPLSARPQRPPAVRAVEDRPGAAGDVAGAASTVLYPPPPPRAYRLRRLRRLRFHGVAADRAQARRPARRALATAGGRWHPGGDRRRRRGARAPRRARRRSSGWATG